jgi:hypothetical protein
MGVRSLLAVLVLSLAAFAGIEGNFVIRFEPTAMLQPQAEIPFQIKVMNDLSHPVHEAKVTMQIETKDHKRVQIFNAPEVTEGVYLAKPVFAEAGDWTLSVTVQLGDRETSRSRDYTIPNAKTY